MYHFIFLFLQTNIGADHESEKGYYKLKIICLLIWLLFPISWLNLSILTCPDHSEDWLQRACLYYNKKKSNYVLITVTGRNVLNTENFDLPEVRTATRSSRQALFQGTLSPLPREARHVLALTSQNVCGNIMKTTSGWCPDYRSQSSKLSTLHKLVKQCVHVIQSNPVNTDNDWAIESVRINEVSS